MTILWQSAQIITSPANTGIPANANRGIRAAKGNWIKLIAGDDILTPACLQLLFEKTQQSHGKVFVGKFVKFVTENDTKIETGIFPTLKEQEFFHKTAPQQLQQLLMSSFNFAPAAFIKKELFENIGYFDEQYRLLEDIPYWIRLTEKGIRFELLDGVVVWYRTNHASTVFAGERFYNTAFMDCLLQFRRQEVYPRVPKSNFIFYQAEFQERLNYQIITKYFGNKKNILSFLVSKIILFPTLKRFLKPFTK